MVLWIEIQSGYDVEDWSWIKTDKEVEKDKIIVVMIFCDWETEMEAEKDFEEVRLV
jgi:hypothetical protein